nr:MAG TPA: hypothetical protein [Bacteriophage sp.]
MLTLSSAFLSFSNIFVIDKQCRKCYYTYKRR